jgi:hypothetical protein
MSRAPEGRKNDGFWGGGIGKSDERHDPGYTPGVFVRAHYYVLYYYKLIARPPQNRIYTSATVLTVVTVRSMLEGAAGVAEGGLFEPRLVLHRTHAAPAPQVWPH